MAESKLYFPALDGIRLFAIGAVVVHHAVYDRNSSMLLRVLGIQEGNGIGVPLFLILSGFLLTGILLNTSSVGNRYRNFLIRRCVRVFPLYYAYLVASLLVTWNTSGKAVHHMWIFAFFLQSNLFLASGGTDSRLPLFHLWTLAVQEQFYLLWPLLVWHCSTLRQVRVLCWAGVLGSLVARVALAHWWGSGQQLYMLLPSRAGELCFGGLLAVEVQDPTVFTPMLRLCALPLGVIYFTWAWRGLNFGSPKGGTFGLLLVTAFCGAIVSLGLDQGTWVYRLLSLERIASLGKKYSYGIFILHPALLMVCFAATRRGQWMRMLFEILGTAVAICASYHFYELPFLQSKVVAGMIKKAPFACPVCKSRYISRTSTGPGIWYSVILPLLGRYSWCCSDCTAHFLGRRCNGFSTLTSVRKKVADLAC